MITTLLHHLRIATRRTALRRLADASGLTRLGRRLYNRRLLSKGVHRVRMMDQPLSFHVESAREIDRIDGLAAEEAFVRRMIDELPAGVLWDVGANIGVVSMVLASARPALTIHAFEPESHNARRMRRNLALNRMARRCTVHELALSNATGRATLQVEGETGSGTHSLDARRQPGGSGVQVETRRGDEMASELGVPAAVKIDVEGAELLVLEGLRGTLGSGAVSDVFIELHKDPIPLPDGRADAEALLEELGFGLAWQHGRGSEKHCHFRRRQKPGPDAASSPDHTTRD